MEGKKICEILKEIRKNIAQKNGIEYEPDNCEHQGSCPGTCPKCDAEANQLLEELKKKDNIDWDGNIELLEKKLQDIHSLNCAVHEYDDKSSSIKEIEGDVNYESRCNLVFDPESGDFILVPKQDTDEGDNFIEFSELEGFA